MLGIVMTENLKLFFPNVSKEKGIIAIFSINI